MQTLESELVVFYDVDETLILHKMDEFSPYYMRVKSPFIEGKLIHLLRNEILVEQLKTHYSRGYKVIVWSAQGYKWCQAVIKELGLEQYVNLVMTKPVLYVDDLPVEKFMTNRYYSKPEGY